jgi:hypothetical protein
MCLKLKDKSIFRKGIWSTSACGIKAKFVCNSVVMISFSNLASLIWKVDDGDEEGLIPFTIK